MKLLQVDAFTDRPFSGNPAAVCLLDREVDDDWMQAVAAEMNLSETAFVAPGDSDGKLPLRWFTPATEVDLCGHATLASAHALWKLRGVATRGVIVTAAAAPPYDFVSRFFAGAVGIDEDPVTGSAHCCLSPYWSERLGRAELVGFQASRRGGVVRTRLDGDRVILGGRAVTVFRGELA